MKKLLVGLFLAILGAFLYDILRPYIFSLINLSFGLFVAFEELIYTQISLGFREVYSLFLLYLFLILPLALLFTLMLLIYFSKGVNNDEFINIIESKFFTEKYKLLNFFIFGLPSIFLLIVTISFMYVHNRITCFEHKFLIISPYIDEEDRIMMKSKFSLVQKKAVYDKILLEMDNIMIENDIEYGYGICINK